MEERLLKDYFKAEANVFVTVKLAGIRYTINGEIGSPGSKIIYRDQVSIMEAIANSGDITLTGDRSDVVIIRQYPAGQKVHHIDLTKLDAMNSPYYYVKPNDLILINPLPQKSLGTGTTGLQSFTTIISITTALVTTIFCSPDYKNMSEEFEINETHTTFDFKGFLFKLLRHWPLFLISLAIAFSIAYYVNVRKLPIYQMENLVSIKDDQNPFFTTNTSLTFNWGGTTDKVNTAVITLQSRSHNEKVVERLQYYMDYLRDGEIPTGGCL